LDQELFEWDDRKAKANLLKHKVGFPEAATIFEDPYVVVEPDLDHSFTEPREKAIGFSVKERVLLVVYVELHARIRLISARRATSEERGRYESQFDSVR
jgi:hypothetical protein